MTPPVPRRVAVYCGSSAGSDERFGTAACELGAALAAAGVGLVYGGGNVGLMGVVADATLAAGGEAIGVITDFLVGKEVVHGGLSRLEVVRTMHERKALMADLADGVVVLPGGFGTLDEAFEMLTWTQLGLQATPVVFLDVAGFWSELFALADRLVDGGFVRPAHRDLVRRAHGAGEALRLALEPVPAGTDKWIDRGTG